MKLLRSTFIVFYLASNNASAFSPQIYSKTLSTRQSSSVLSPSVSQSSTTSLFIGMHEQPESQISKEAIQRDIMFREVLKEVNMAKEYLGYLVEESGSTDIPAESEGEGETFGEILESKAAAGEVELFGGGGDAPAERPKETQYQPSLRTDLGSTVLLSGTADSTLLSILNNNFFGQDMISNFNFSTIKALVADVGAAKKSTISREARYGGLLDKLVIEPASSDLPSKEELAGASSWIVQLASEDAAASLPKIAELAKGSEDLTNVVVLVVGTSSNSVDGWDVLVEASADGAAFKCTLLAVGELHDGTNTGGFYHMGALGSETTVDSPKLSKKKAYQLLAHALSLDSTSNEALTAYEYPPAALEAVATPYAEGEFIGRDDDGNEVVDEFKDVKMESRMIQAMREVGFTPVMEVDVLVSKGIAGYKEYIANPPNKENVFSSKTKSARDEEDERIMAILEVESAKTKAVEEAAAAKKRKEGIEGIAKEWSIKEYSLRMLGGDLDESTSEKDFKVSVWADALAEGELTYDRINTEEYKREKERTEKSKKGTENKLFWDGMPPLLRKKREKMVEKVKKQYMDLLSEEELENLILNE